jgi:hypothetical protein
MGEVELPRVFLCHASDDKPEVRKYADLLKAEGIDVWLDEDKLLPGQEWQREIPKAVRNSDAVIIFISKNSINKEGYLQREIRVALDVMDEKPDGTVFLIPARLEECQVPDRLLKWQYVNLYDESGFRKLLLGLNLRFNQMGKKAEPKAQASPSKSEPNHKKIGFDSVGFPMVWIPKISAFCHFLPVTKIQFEHFLSDSPSIEIDEKVYAEICQENPRVNLSNLTSDNFWGAFVTGVAPWEVRKYIDWCGFGYSVPTVSEWRIIQETAKSLPVVPPELLLGHKNIRAESLLQKVWKIYDEAHLSSTQNCLADQMLLDSPICEWVTTSTGKLAGSWGGNSGQFATTEYQRKAEIRILDYGFRLIKRV